MSESFVSDFAKLEEGGRVLISLIGSVNRNENQIFVTSRSGELLLNRKFATADAAEIELLSFEGQIEAWERAQASKPRR